jgi:hypothetical protein
MELHAHFSKLLVGHVQDVDTQLATSMEKIAGLDDVFNTKLDAKFQEVLTRLPAPAPPFAPSGRGLAGRARHVPLAN